MASTSKKKKFATLRTPMKELNVNELLNQLFASTAKKTAPSLFDDEDLELSFKREAQLIEDSFKESDINDENDSNRSLVNKQPTPKTPLSVKRSGRNYRGVARTPVSSSTTTPRADRLMTSSTPVPVDEQSPSAPMTGVKPLPAESPPLRCTPFTSTPLNVSTSSTGGIQYKFNVDYESPTKDLTKEERANILLGITCYVEARNDKDDASEAVKGELIKLGAKIEKYFTRKVTHIIFKEGRMSTYLKAKQWGIPLVSVLWIDACKRARQPVDPAQYRPKKMEKYDNVPPWACLKKRRFGGLLKIIRGGKNKLDDTRDERADSLIEQRSEDVSTPLLKLRRGDDKPISDTKHRRKALPGTKGVFSKKKLDFDSQDQAKLIEVFGSDRLRHSAPAELQSKSSQSDVDTGSTSTEDSQSRVIKELTGGFKQGQRRKVRRLLDAATQVLNFDSETPRTSDDGDESPRSVSPPVFAPMTLNALPVKRRRRSSAPRESLVPLSEMAEQAGDKKKSPPCLVFSGITPEEKNDYISIVNSLGNFECEKAVTKRTTHLVTCSPVKRTVNVVKALARGCWILSVDWVLRSKQCGKWMPEESYELTSFCPAVKKNRLERQAFGKDFCHDLFSKCGRIFVSRKTQPPQTDLIELLRMGRASLTRVMSRAELIVDSSRSSPREGGEESDAVPTVKETWILDCVTQGKTLDPSDYLY